MQQHETAVAMLRTKQMTAQFCCTNMYIYTYIKNQCDATWQYVY